MNKLIIYIAILSGALSLYSCVELDLTPDQQKTSEAFYSNEKELRLAANALYQHGWVIIDDPNWSDNIFHKDGNGTDAITNGTINGATDFVEEYWRELYQGIAAANKLLENMDDANVSSEVYTQINAEARFFRAYYYSILITHYGDVPFIIKSLSFNDGSTYDVKRTSYTEIKKFIYDELDYAASKLPSSNRAADLQTVTAGAVLGIKARTALYLEDYAIAKDAAKAVIGLGVHKLYPDYGGLFHVENQINDEFIFSIPRSILYGGALDNEYVRQRISRNSGGYASEVPSMSMVDIYECTDGNTIDKSNLYDPHNPFKNRDPRMTYSIVEHGTPWLGYIFQPHPDSSKVLNLANGKMVKNNDSKSVNEFASYTGFIIKKGVEQTWINNKFKGENPKVVLRYADVLLMYAEAKIKLGEIDDSVLDAINSIRARAYKVGVGEVDKYPAITTKIPSELTSILRRERRVELFNEGLRYMDLIRWKLADDALNMSIPIMNNIDNIDRSQWPFNNVILPIINEDGIVDHSAIIAKGYLKEYARTSFDKTRQYLWPIPSSERLLNDKLTQNPGY